MTLNDIDRDTLVALYQDVNTLAGVQYYLDRDYRIKTSIPTLSRRLGKAVKASRKATKKVDLPQQAEIETAQVSDDDYKPIAGGDYHAFDRRETKLEGRRFVITSAQNNTHVFADALSALENYCNVNEAQLIVSTFGYNKSGWATVNDDKSELWYDDRLVPYILDDRCRLGDSDLVLCGELDILPTAILPMSGLQSYTKSDSCIIPHAKMQMESVDTAKHMDAKLMYTTGAITLRNYIQKKTGQKAEFHHVYGALVVEIDTKGQWFVRQVQFDDDGSFYDLDELYSVGGHSFDNPVLTVSLGDIHAEKLDAEAADVAFRMVCDLNPEEIFLHDLTDFQSRNHHNIKDPHFLFNMRKNTRTVEADMFDSAEFIHNLSLASSSRINVVNSNHDQAFLRWLKDKDGHMDADNMLYWHKWNYEVLSKLAVGASMDPFASAVQEQHLKVFGYDCPARFLDEDQSVLIKNVEHGSHGHRGPGGSRGNPKNHRALGSKFTTGHTHKAGIIDGVYTGGVTGKLDMGYNKGPSGWTHSHVVMYKSGARCIITTRGNSYRA